VRLDIFMAVEIQVVVFWLMTPCSGLEDHDLNLHHCLYPTTSLHGVITQNTVT